MDILVATPGRLNDLIGQGHITLEHIEIFVLDEADRMLDMGFIHDVRKVIALLPRKRQTLLFSATMPAEVEKLAPVSYTHLDVYKRQVRAYVAGTGRRVVFEYALIDGLNSRPAHARELARLLRGLQCHVNLIPLNHVDERRLRPATPDAVRAFQQTLEAEHISATVRREMGADIGGACGQLRRSRLRAQA